MQTGWLLHAIDVEYNVHIVIAKVNSLYPELRKNPMMKAGGGHL